MQRLMPRIHLAALTLLLLTPALAGKTHVTLDGENFRINSHLTYSDIPTCPPEMHGLLFNVRAVNATFDDLDLGKGGLPEGFLDDDGHHANNNHAGYGPWDPDANTDRFIAALPSWRAKGILAVTLNFQGGCSCTRNGEHDVTLAGDNQTPNNNPFGKDGAPIKPAYLDRMARCIDALDANGMVCILGLFYFGQDQRISTANDSQAILRAVDAAIDWVIAHDWRNVIIEINNETTVGAYQHDILQPDRVHELFKRVKQRSASPGRPRLLVSASSTGTALPPDSWMREADLFLPHGNGLNAAQITKLVADYRAHPLFKANPRPICFNEDSVSITNLNAAAAGHASWGFYNDPHIQSVYPANWTIWSPEDKAFFNRVAELVGAPPSEPIPYPTPNPADPVNYIAWMNETFSQGIERNAAEMYLKAFEEMQPFEGDWENAYLQPWSDNPELEKWLTDNDNSLRLLRVAARTPDCYFALSRPSKDADGKPLHPRVKDMLAFAPLPHIRNHRLAVRGVLAQGFRSAASGDVKTLQKDALVALRAARHLDREPMLLRCMTGWAEASAAYEALFAVLAESPDPATARTILASLRRYDPPFASLHAPVLIERINLLDFLQRFFKPLPESKNYILVPEVAEGLMLGADTMIGKAGILAIGYEKSVAEFNRYFDAVDAYCATPGHELQPTDHRKELVEKSNNLLATTLLPALDRIPALRLRAETTRRALHLTAALLAEKTPPPTLADLAGKTDLNILDPVTNKPFIYQPAGKTFKLYSIGLNRKDDNAQHAPKALTDWDTTGDQVFWPRP